MSATRTRIATALACVTLGVLLAAPATAHQFRPTLLRADVGTDGRHDVIWKTDALDPRAIAGTEIAFGDGCTANLSEATTDTERVAHFAIACTDTPLVMRFPHEPIEVVLDLRLDGVPRRIERLGTVPLELDVSELVGAEPEAHGGPVGIGSWFVLGVEHIVFGWDHLCFVIALAFLVATPRRVIAVVTGFTLGHTVTLLGATLHWVPRPHGGPVEAVIALSILYLAVELTRGADARERFGHGLGFAVASVFGLVHGFGFAGALAEFSLPPGAEVPALVAFNVGVEAGQLAVVVAALGVRAIVIRGSGGTSRSRADAAFRYATAYAVGIVSVYWLAERTLAIVAR